MKSSAYGVVAIPAPSQLPAGGKDVASHVAGINISIFKNTKNQAAALQFVNFMTSPAEQASADKPFAALPVVNGGVGDFTNHKAEATAFSAVLATKAVPLPLIAAESEFETKRWQRRQRPARAGSHGRDRDDR